AKYMGDVGLTPMYSNRRLLLFTHAIFDGMAWHFSRSRRYGSNSDLTSDRAADSCRKHTAIFLYDDRKGIRYMLLIKLSYHTKSNQKEGSLCLKIIT
ncbi:hypothetical protein CEW92_14945, partial [Bacillaceae bacterium SAS-127]